MNLEAIQSALREAKLDGWLFYDHHRRDPIAYRVLGINPVMCTRRWYYVIPREGNPAKLVHRIESHNLDALPGNGGALLFLARAARRDQQAAPRQEEHRDAILGLE